MSRVWSSQWHHISPMGLGGSASLPIVSMLHVTSSLSRHHLVPPAFIVWCLILLTSPGSWWFPPQLSLYLCRFIYNLLRSILKELWDPALYFLVSATVTLVQASLTLTSCMSAKLGRNNAKLWCWAHSFSWCSDYQVPLWINLWKNFSCLSFPISVHMLHMRHPLFRLSFQINLHFYKLWIDGFLPLQYFSYCPKIWNSF